MKLSPGFFNSTLIWVILNCPGKWPSSNYRLASLEIKMENTSEQDLSKDVRMKSIGDDLHSMEASDLRTSSGLTVGSTSMESPMNNRYASWSFWFIFALTDSFNVMIFCLKNSLSLFARMLVSYFRLLSSDEQKFLSEADRW